MFEDIGHDNIDMGSECVSG